MVVFLVILLLILINALYVAAEFAAVSVRKSRLQQLAEDGNRLAERFLPYAADPHKLDRFVATSQIGITLSSLVLGAYGQTALAPRLLPLFVAWGGLQEVAAESSAAVVVLVGLTASQMVLGELVPKSIALQFPTPTARYTVIPMQWSIRMLSWFITVLNGSGLAVLRLLGVRQAGHVHIHTPDEIEYLIAESREGGLLAPDEHARLKEALRLGVTKVNEVMVPRTAIHAISADAPFSEMLQTASESPYTRFPIYRDSIDTVLGYVHVQDIARHALAGGKPPPLRRILVVPEVASLERVLERLRTERQHIALVVDEYGGIAGLVSIGDILDAIFGGVADEFKTAEPEPVELPDGRVRLPGSLRLREAAERLGTSWEGDSVTVGGFVMEHFGHIPRAGERIVIENVPLEVEQLSGRQIVSILAGPLPQVEEDRG